MSGFSDKLRQIIEERELKIYQLAKNAGVDRTTIQRSITGERIPGVSFIEKLIDYLRLSPSERDELLKLYSICRVGEKVYEGRKYIKEMIEGIAAIQKYPAITSPVLLNIPLKDITEGAEKVYTGKYMVDGIVRHIIDYEVVKGSNPVLNISVPFSYTFLYDLLYQIYLSGNIDIAINNMIRLNKKSAYQDSNYNLNVLSRVIPFAFSSRSGYNPVYYYESFDASIDNASLFPFYIITGNHLLLLSLDYRAAVLINDNSIINAYTERFKAALHKSKPIITQLENCDDLLLAYLGSQRSYGNVSHVIEPQPCFAWYFTNNIVNSHIRQELENRDLILELLYEFYAGYQNSSERPISIFSIEGLDSFVSTGTLAVAPTGLVLPFTVNERIMLLTKLKNDISNGIYRAYAARSNEFKIPFCTIQLYNTKKLEFFHIDSNGLISSSYTEEKSITEAFYDFFESLPQSGLLYDEEGTIRVIDECIEKCSNLA